MPSPRTIYGISALAGMLALATLHAQDKPQPGPPVSFNREILPILANNCFACHGPDEKHRETKFHFDTEDGAFVKKGVIVRGSAVDSLLIEKITEPNPKDRMPPPDSGHVLTERQIDLLRRFSLPAEPGRPIIAIISRLVSQKGYDLIRQAAGAILDTGAFFIGLGAGAREYEDFLQSWHDAAPNRVGIYKGYAGEPLAHQIEAGADMFLMPSLYEP